MKNLVFNSVMVIVLLCTIVVASVGEVCCVKKIDKTSFYSLKNDTVYSAVISNPVNAQMVIETADSLVFNHYWVEVDSSTNQYTFINFNKSEIEKLFTNGLVSKTIICHPEKNFLHKEYEEIFQVTFGTEDSGETYIVESVLLGSNVKYNYLIVSSFVALFLVLWTLAVMVVMKGSKKEPMSESLRRVELMNTRFNV